MEDDNRLRQGRQLIVIAVLTGVLIAWMALGKMDVVANAEGRVITSEHVSTLQNLEGGIITEILIKSGDHVRQGELLFRLNSVQYSSDLESSRKQNSTLKVRAIRLMAEITQQTPRFDVGLSNVVPEVIQSELAEYAIRQERILQLTQFVKLAEKEYAMIQGLTKEGLEPQTELIRSERTLAERQQAVREQREAALAEYNRIASEIKAKEDVLVSLGDKVRRTDIFSPIDGVVGRVFMTTAGGVVKPGDVLVEIVPNEGPMIIEAKLKPSDVAFVMPGMKAHAKITAYDYALFGTFDATVKSVSPDAITNEKGESFYTVRLTSTEKVLDKLGKPLEILPGMVAQVGIATEKRTFFNYLFKPFTDITSNSFKER
jgi:adhesin transport system membrane fusion protein